MSKTPVSNPFAAAKGGAKKPMNNPFGDLKVYQNEEEEFEQISYQQPASHASRSISTPYRPVDNDPDELQGNITINPSEPKRYNSDPRQGSISNPFGRNASSQPIQQPFNTQPNQQNQRGNNPRGNYDYPNDPRYDNRQVPPNPQFVEDIKKNPWWQSLLAGFNFLKATNPNLAPQSEAENIDYNDDDLSNEPPLLEDLGIDLELIKMRALSVLKMKKPDERAANESDFWGPLLLFMALGMLLLLSGKIHFGYIYGFGLMGTILIFLIMNLLGQSVYAKYYNTLSILGYSLFPIVILSAINIVFNLQNLFGFILALGAILSSTYSATNFFEVLLQLDHRKWLVAYPIFLFYLVFVLITIF